MSICHTKDESQITLSSEKFTFTLDPTFLLAQSLALNALNPMALKQIQDMYNSMLSLSTEEEHGVDARLVQYFKQLNLPQSWRLWSEEANASSGNY